MIIDNENIKLRDVLEEWVEKSDEVLICSPFISSTDVLFNLLDRKIKFTLICRLSYPATPQLFERIIKWLNNEKKVYVYDDNSLHSKIYYFKKNGNGLVSIIGSSNFTDNGIYSNKEYNILLASEFENLEKYFENLVDESYSKLNQKTIDYYKTFFRKPIRTDRFKEGKISSKLSNDYSNTLEKYYIAKGLLENENNTELPFTYVFDSFCHQFKTRIINDYRIKEMNSFNEQKLKKYFKLFVKKYFDESDIDWRMQRFRQAEYIRNNLHELKSSEIKDFFLGIHSVVYGSGSGLRIQNIKSINKSHLIRLLDFLINSNLSMSHKYSLALTKKEKNRYKIDYLGESTIGEIPGWLIPENYPIKNGKLHFVFEFFKL